MARDNIIEFTPIPIFGGGALHLAIHPPGTWFDNTEYIPFVGGYGYDGAATLAEAKVLLQQHAERRLQQYIDEGEARLRHNQEQLARLQREGLSR